LPNGKGVAIGGPATTAGAPTGRLGDDVATGGPIGTDPGGKPGGAIIAGGGSLGHANNRSPVGSIRGPCHAAQPANIIAQTAIAARETRVGMLGNISTGFHARRASFAREPGGRCPRGTWGGRLENDRAPGQRTRSAQSTSLSKPTAQFAACCPNATRFDDFPQQTLRVTRVITILTLVPSRDRGQTGGMP